LYNGGGLPTFQYGLTFPLLLDRTWPIKITIIGQYSIIYIPMNMD
jgi:hypothetical protein